MEHANEALWRPQNHHVWPRSFRRVVVTILCVDRRLYDKGLNNKSTRIDGMMKTLHLPKVIWIDHIIPFLSSRDEYSPLPPPPHPPPSPCFLTAASAPSAQRVSLTTAPLPPT